MNDRFTESCWPSGWSPCSSSAASASPIPIPANTLAQNIAVRTHRAEIEDGDDVQVAQTCECIGLAVEALDEGCILSQLVREDP
jgi:hypothetical protein